MDSAQCTANQRLTQALVSRVLIAAWSCRCGRASVWPILVFSPSGNPANSTWPKGPTINHIVELPGVAQGLVYKRHSYQAGHSKGLENHLPRAEGGQGPDLSVGKVSSSLNRVFCRNRNILLHIPTEDKSHC